MLLLPKKKVIRPVISKRYDLKRIATKFSHRGLYLLEEATDFAILSAEHSGTLILKNGEWPGTGKVCSLQ